MKFNDEVMTPDGKGVIKGFESESYEGFAITTAKPAHPSARARVRVGGKIKSYEIGDLT